MDGNFCPCKQRSGSGRLEETSGSAQQSLAAGQGALGERRGDFGCHPLLAHLPGQPAPPLAPRAALLRPRASLPSPLGREELVLFCQGHSVLLPLPSCPRRSPCRPLQGTRQSAPAFAARAGAPRRLLGGFPNPTKIRGSVSSSTAGATRRDQTPSRRPCTPGRVPRPWWPESNFQSPRMRASEEATYRWRRGAAGSWRGFLPAR